MADLKESIYDLINAQPKHRMKLHDIAKHILVQFPERHVGEVRREIRMLVDEHRIQLEKGAILVIADLEKSDKFRK